jgi:hypothetical protein
MRITLDKSFIETVRDRATIAETWQIDKSLANPHAQKDDRCLHIAARCDQSRLPAVIEIKNARTLRPWSSPRQLPTRRAPLMCTVRRLAVEQANNAVQTQGSGINSLLDTANPAHVYEIHPILTIRCA